MIDTRLTGLLSHAKKYIVYNIFWQWISLLAQIGAVFSIAGLLGQAAILLESKKEEMFFIQGQNTNGLYMGQTLIVLTICVAVRFICEKLAARASCQASVDVKQVLRKRIYRKMLSLGASYHEQVSTSEVMQVCTEGVEQLEIYFGKYLPQLFYSLLAPLTLFFVLMHISLRASAVLLICVPLIPVSIVAVQKLAKRLLNRYWSIYTGLGDSFLENLQGMTTLKIYQADEMKAKEMDKEAQIFRRITMKVLTMQLNSTSVMDIVAYGGAAAGMIVAASEFLAGTLSFAGALTIILLASEFFIPLRLLGSFFHIAMNGMAASDKIFAILDIPETKISQNSGDKAEGQKRNANFRLKEESLHASEAIKDVNQEEITGKKMKIQFRNLHFSYEKDREILAGIDLDMPAGAFISLVGESGCGKSTIAGILAGRNRGFSGSVTVNGTALEEISEEALMKNVTLIRHNSYLFKGTVEENLRMAKPDAKESEMREVLARVNLLGFLDGQKGVKTELLEQAENLSGGQRQRLALARALLHDSPVYVFDEATSNIDAESEEFIMKVIRQLSQTKTVLLISHRLANVVDSDCIYMMKDGKICEQGKHKELLALDGTYGKLYKGQMELENYSNPRRGNSEVMGADRKEKQFFTKESKDKN